MRARGATVFLTSHVLEIVEKLCTDVGIIAKGKLVHQGTMDEIRPAARWKNGSCKPLAAARWSAKS